MAGSFCDYLENEILDHITGKGSFTMPAQVDLALFTVAPTDAGGGTEVTGGSYARVTTAAANWNVAASGSISNAQDLTFPTATADWGTVVAFALLDGSSNYLVWGDLSASKAVNNGDTAKFAGGTPGDLVITLG